MGMDCTNDGFIELLVQKQELPFKVEKNMSSLKGTIIVAAKYGRNKKRNSKGVIIASDKYAVTPVSGVAAESIQKLFAIDEHSVVGVSGVYGYCKELVDILRLDIEQYRRIEEQELSAVGKVRRLAKLISINRHVFLGGVVILPILVCYDKVSREPRIFCFDTAGAFFEKEKFWAIGATAEYAIGSMERVYRRRAWQEVSRDEAVENVVVAVDIVCKMNPACGYVDVPDVKDVCASGIRNVSRKKLEEILGK